MRLTRIYTSKKTVSRRLEDEYPIADVVATAAMTSQYVLRRSAGTSFSTMSSSFEAAPAK